MKTSTKYHSVIRIDTENYGYILSRHRTTQAADSDIERREARVLRSQPRALTHLMYTRARVAGDVG